jgi:preprotein translocase subunit SecE
MAVETRKMSITGSSGFAEQIRSWPGRIKSFYNDVRTEMRKVTAPGWKEVQATTLVVVVTVFLFGLYFFIIDKVIQTGVSYVFSYFKTH